jgi:ligand-binding sensor domain-containing protein/signal transduction histidine kinase
MLLALVSCYLAASTSVQQVYSRFIPLEQTQAHTSSTALVQDSDGQIWLGTQHGLYRFNGTDVKIFRADPTNPDTLSADWVSSLLVDQQGTLWVGTRYAGLNRFDADTERFERIALPVVSNTGASAEISVLYQDPQQQIWVGSYGSGLFRWDPKENKLQHLALPEQVDGVSTLHLNDVIMDQQGLLWLAVGDAPVRTMAGATGGLIRWQLTNNQLTGFLKTADSALIGSVNKLRQTADGTLLLASFSGGLLQMTKTQPAPVDYAQPAALQTAQLTDMLLDEQDGIWLSSFNSGLWYQPTATAPWQNFQHLPQFSTGLPSNNLYALMLDRQGTLWTLSQSRISGLSRFARQVQTLPHVSGQPNLLPVGDVLGIDAVTAEKVWLANRDGGLLHFNPQTKQLLPVPSPATPVPFSARQVVEDRRQLVWVGTETGLWQYQSQTQQWQEWPLLKYSPQQPVIKSLFEDRQQRLWIGTRGHGLFMLDATRKNLRRYHRQGTPEFPFDDVNMVYQDSYDGLWVGSADQGLAKLEPDNGKFLHWQQQQATVHGLQFNGIQLIVEENQQLWIHAGNVRHRLIRQQGDPARILGFKPYLSDEDIDNELHQADLFRLLYRRHWLSGAASYLNLDESLGMQSVTWIGSWDSLDGQIFRGGKEGIDYFRIADLPRDWRLSALELTNLSLFNQMVPPARPESQQLLPVVIDSLNELSLLYKQDMFSIHFAAAEFVLPRHLEYRYQLAGFDRDWILAQRPIATYTRLPPGTYTFQVEARISGGNWQGARQLSVRVLPPWWMTWWFRSGLAAFVMLSGWAWYQQKMTRQLEMRRKLERLVTQRTEELSHKTDQLQEKHQALQRSYQDVTLLQQISTEITASLDLKQVLTRCHHHLSQILDAHVLLIGIYRETEHKLDFAFWMEDNQLAPRFDIDLEQEGSPGVICFNQQREIIIGCNEDFLNYMPQVPEPLYGKLTQSVLYFPLTVSGKAVGVFSVQSLDPHAYSDSQIVLLRTLASYVAISVANADSFEQLQLTQQQLITQEKMASLGALVAGVAHEINTPLGICVTASSHLQTELETIQQALDSKNIQQSQFQRFLQHLREGLKILQVNTARAADLVQSFKQVSVDQSNVSLREFSLRGYLQDVLLTLKPQLHKAGCALDFQCPNDIELYTDAGAIAQIITNLVLNSLLHGVNQVEDPRIQISFSQEGRMVVLKFGDNGVGMDQRALTHIFEPFYTTKRNNGGTGLGTHIVFNLVSGSLKGQIDVQSAPGAGLHYKITFPARRDI